MRNVRQSAIAIGCFLVLVGHGQTLFSFQTNGKTSASANQAWLKQRHFMNLVQQVIHEKDVVRELEIVDSQLGELKSAFSKFRVDVDRLAVEMRKRMLVASDSELSVAEKENLKNAWEEELSRQLLVHAEPTIKKIDSILLPHQIARLRQFATQRELLEKVQGDRSKLILALAPQLDLSRTESQKLKRDVARLRQKYLEDVAQLKRKYDKELLDSLPPKASKKVKDLIGDIYID